MKSSIVIPRLKAFAIDYLIILGYICLLFVATMAISRLLDADLDNIDTLTGELIGFLTLTLPVILYFSFTEAGKYGGSMGKRRLNLKVIPVNRIKTSFFQVLLRNVIKFLPWEIAHFFVFQLYYFTRKALEPPGWILWGLLFSQLIAVLYLVFLFFHKENRSIYELLSSTKVVRTNKAG